jgi:hypothetical protein
VKYLFDWDPAKEQNNRSRHGEPPAVKDGTTKKDHERRIRLLSWRARQILPSRRGALEIHRDELMADWQLAVEGQPVFKIEPLR